MNEEHTWAKKPKNISYTQYVKTVFEQRSFRQQEWDSLVAIHGMLELERILEGKPTQMNTAWETK